jgi:GAF domain-containing protein
MALPLRVADQIIGVLDIQSIISNAFQDEDIEVLSTLADQVSIAIQNARSYEITHALLAEAQKSSGAFLREAWRVLQAQEQTTGYQISNNKLLLLQKPITSRHVQEAVASRKTVKVDGENPTLVVPIRIRDEVVGIMDIRVPDDHDWDADELDVAEAVAERLSLALESSLLLKSTQRRAEIERVTADISSKIGASTQFDAILRTAAEELSRALGGSEVLVQINRETFEEEV